MSVLSAGFYIFYWYYLTWKHYRDYTGEIAYPIWHALTLFVPIYNLFRTHAHMRTYMELMLRRNLATSINPGMSVALVFASFFLDNISFRLSFGEITEGLAVILLVIAMVSVGIVTWLLASVQSNLNKYWQSVSSSALSARIGVGEVILAIIGVLFWIDAIATVFNDSYRTGFY